MKKVYLIISFLIFVVTVAVGQERTKMVMELKNGTSITGFVMEQEDGSYLVETESGDILFFRQDEVSGIRKPGEEKGDVLQLLKSATGNSVGATASGNQGNLLKRRGFSLTFRDTGVDLKPDQVSRLFWDEYNSAARRKRSGMKMMIAGGATASVGSLLYLLLGEGYYQTTDSRYGWTYDNYYITDVGYVGMGVMAAGLGLTTWGAIKFFIGNAKLGRLAKQYNSGNGYFSELSFEYSPAGLSLVYSF